MIYFICSIMVTMPDDTRSTQDLHGYGQKIGTMIIIDLQKDADSKGYKNTDGLRNYTPFPGECTIE